MANGTAPLTANATLSPDEFDRQFDAGQIKPDAGAQLNLSPDEFDAQYDRAHALRPPGVVAPETPVGQEPPPKPVPEANTLQGHLEAIVKPYYNFLADETKIGIEGVHEGEEGFRAQWGHQSYEDAQAALKASQQDASDAQKRSQIFRDTNSAYHAFSFVGPAAQSIPFLTKIVQAYSAGFVPGAFVGGATAGPGGALASGALAGDASAFGATAALLGGHAYMDYRDKGHSHEEAQVWGTASGLTQAFITTLRLGQATAPLRNMIIKGAAPLANNGVTQYLKTVAAQTALGITQETAHLAMDAAIAYTSGRKGEAPTFPETLNRLSQAAKDSLVQAAALTGAATLGAKAIKPWVIPKTVNQTLRVQKQMANNPQANLAELPEPKQPVEPLEIEEPKIEARTKIEIERDEKREAANRNVESFEKEHRKFQLEVSKLEPAQRQAYADITSAKLALDRARTGLRKEGQEFAGYSKADVERAQRKLRARERYFDDLNVQERALKGDLQWAKEQSELARNKRDELEESHRQDALDQIKNKVRDAKGQGEHADALRLINDFVDSPDKALEAVQAHINNPDFGKTSTAFAAKIADFIGDVRDKSSQELFKLNAEIKDFKDTERKTVISKALAERAEVKATNAEYTKAFNGDRPVEQSAGGTGSKKNFLKNPLDVIEAPIASWSGELQIAMQDLKDLKLRTELIDKLDLNKPANRMIRLEAEGLETLQGYLKDGTGMSTGSLHKYLSKAGKDEIKFGYLDADGKEATYETDKLTAIDLWANKNDPTLTEGFKKGNKFSGSAFGVPLEGSERTWESQMSKALSTDDKKVAQAFKNFYKYEQGPKLRRAFYEENGVTIDLNEDYAGKAQRRRPHENEVLEETLSQSLANKPLSNFRSAFASTPKSSIQRTRNQYAIVGENAYAKAVKAVRELARYEAFAKDGKPIARLLADPKAKFVLQSKYGNDFYDYMVKHATDVIRGPDSRANSVWTKAVNLVLRKVGFAFLALKPLQYVKQRTAGINFALHLPADQLVAQHLEYYRGNNRAKYEELFKDSLQARYDNFQNTIANAIINNESTIEQRTWVKDFLMSPILKGDKDTVLPGMAAVYEHALANGETHEAAITKAEKALAEQGSANIAELSALSRDPNSKIISIFLQQPMSMAAKKIQSWRDFFKNPTKENLRTVVNTVVVTHVAQGLYASIGAGISFSVAANEKRREQIAWDLFNQTWVGPQLPVIGDVNIGLMLAAEDLFTRANPDIFEHQSLMQNWREFKTIPDDIILQTLMLVNDAVSAESRLEKGAEPEDLAIDAGLHFSRSIGALLGYPLEPPFSLLKLIRKQEKNAQKQQ